MKFNNKHFWLAIGCLALTACSNDPDDGGSGDTQPGDVIDCSGYSAMYLLNEGGWGHNNARIDVLDFTSGTYSQDAYVSANPSTVLELGDVGNDFQLHNQRLYAVLNGSHKVEVMNAANLTRIGQVNVSSPRYVAFTSTHGYVTSYVDGNNDNGSVVEFDLSSLQITRTVSVGQEPEGIAIVDNKLYVAHSGGLHYPNYSDQIWEINISDLSITDKITVAPNLNRLFADSDGALWVNSNGNYADIGSGLYRIKNGEVKSANVPCMRFTISGETVYYYASEWSNSTYSYAVSYGTVDRNTLASGSSFITDGTETEITMPYGIFATGDLIFVMDAKDYVSSGAVNIYDNNGKLIDRYTAGICPSSAIFIPKNS